MGKKRVIAETGAGQHGVATATAAALFGLDCTVYMGAVDVERQALNVWRMRLLGAEVVPVRSGSATLKDAVNEAMRAWVATRRGDALLPRFGDGAASVPVDGARVPACRRRRSARAVAARSSTATIPTSSSRASAAARTRSARSPGSSTPSARLVGVEAGGLGLESGHHGAAVERGVPGVVHGMRSLFLQDEYGQVLEATSISAGLDYPGVGPEHAMLAAQGRAEYHAATDDEALAGFQLLAETEGHRARARTRARDRLARARGRPRGPDGRRPCSSRCRAGATRTRRRSPNASGRSRAEPMNLEVAPAGAARRGPQAARAVRHRRARPRVVRRRARGRRQPAPTRSRSGSRSPTRSWTAARSRRRAQRALDLGATPVERRSSDGRARRRRCRWS